MNTAGAQNPFAPPRAVVAEVVDDDAMIAASRGSRFAAAIIDSVGSWVVLVGILAAVALPAYANYARRAKGLPVSHPDAGAAFGLVMLVVSLLLLGLMVCNIVFLYRYGQTVGKRLMGIRVVRGDGGRVAFGRFVFLRWLPLFVVGIIPYLGGLVTLLDLLLIFRDSSKCLHDDIADTRVVTALSSESATLAGASGASLRTISF